MALHAGNISCFFPQAQVTAYAAIFWGAHTEPYSHIHAYHCSLASMAADLDAEAADVSA